MGIVNHDIEMVREKYPAFEISKRESDYIFRRTYLKSCF